MVEIATSFVNEKLGRKADVLFYWPTGAYGILKLDLAAGKVAEKLEYKYFNYTEAFDIAKAYCEIKEQN